MNRHLPFYWFVFIFIVALFTLSECFYLYKDIQATAWPTTIGHIHNTRVPTPTPSPNPKKDGAIFQPSISLKLSYSYRVEGILYSSDNVSFGHTFSNDIEQVGAGIQHETSVKVHFNPSDPKEAVLIPGPKTINIFLIVFGFLLLYRLTRRVRQHQ